MGWAIGAPHLAISRLQAERCRCPGLSNVAQISQKHVALQKMNFEGWLLRLEIAYDSNFSWFFAVWGLGGQSCGQIKAWHGSNRASASQEFHSLTQGTRNRDAFENGDMSCLRVDFPLPHLFPTGRSCRAAVARKKNKVDASGDRSGRRNSKLPEGKVPGLKVETSLGT